MSTLVLCRPRPGQHPELGWTPLAALGDQPAFARAVACWGLEAHPDWFQVPRWEGRHWDAWIDRAADGAVHRSRLISAFRELAGRSASVRVWYAGFSDGLVVARTVDAFAACLEGQLRDGEGELYGGFERSLSSG